MHDELNRMRQLAGTPLAREASLEIVDAVKNHLQDLMYAYSSKDKHYGDVHHSDIRQTMDIPAMKRHLGELIPGATHEAVKSALFDYDTEWRETVVDLFLEKHPALKGYVEKLQKF